jgi:group I intron endonuclease
MQDQWVLHEGEILEYCESGKCLEREQYYIDLLNPKYNLLKIAGSRLGSIHTKETKAKMSSSQKGKKTI